MLLVGSAYWSVPIWPHNNYNRLADGPSTVLVIHIIQLENASETCTSISFVENLETLKCLPYMRNKCNVTSLISMTLCG